MRRARFVAVLLSVSLLLASACDGCDGCADDDTVPADPQQRVNSLAALIPATTDAAVVAPEIAEMSDSLDYAFSRAEHYNPDARDFEREFSRRIGFRISDAESWDAAGFNPDGAMILSMVGPRPVLAAHLDDTSAFESNFIAQLRRHFDAQSPIEERDLGDLSFRVSGEGMADDMAWYFTDSAVVVVMPPFDVLEAFETGTAMSVANKLTTVDDETSLAGSEQFAQFQNGILDDFPIGVYFDSERYFDRSEMEDSPRLFGGADAIVDSLVEWSQENASGGGIGLKAADRQFELRAFAAADDEIVAEAREAFAVEGDVDVDGMLTENTTIALRTDVDLSKAVETYLDNLPDARRRSFERQMSRLGRNYELDFEDDVIGAFSGHNMLVFYGVGGDIDTAASQMLAGDLPGGVRTILRNSGLMVNFHFRDTDNMQTLVDRATDFGGNHLNRRPLEYDGSDVDDVEILEPTDLRSFPARVYLDEQSATLSTAGINEESAYEYLTDRREENRLQSVDDLRLGGEFADADTLNGLYVNFANLRSNMREIGPPVSGYASFIQPLNELLLTSGVDEHGFYLSTRVDFTAPLEDDDE